MNPITSIDGGFLDYYTLAWPLGTAGQDDALVSVALVVMKRNGGLLLGLPVGFIPVEDLQAASDQESGSVLGPHTTFTIPAIREDGQAVLEGQDVEVLVIDASDDVLPALGNFESVDGASFFFADDASLAPAPDQLLRAVKDWLAAQSSTKTAFYSADEEMIPDPVLVPETPMEPDQNLEEETPKGRRPAAAKAGKRVTTASLAEQLGSVTELLPAIASRLDMIQQEQITMKGQLAGAEHIVPPRPSQQPVSTSLSAFAKLMGSPPRVKAAPAVAVPLPKAPTTPVPRNLDSPLTLQEQAEEFPASGSSTLAQAVLEQSKALTTLVAQLQSGGDPLLDSHGSSSGVSLGSKGAAGRERLQAELSNRSGQFFLMVTQNAWKRMKPASRLPQTLDSVSSTDFSMVTYLEKFGGYGSCRELGLIQYCLAHIFDCALHADLDGVREHVALTMTSLEQAAQDNNRWELAYQLTLLEDPPNQLWSYRQAGQNPRLRAFAPLCPQRWATIALAYMKEVDYIQNRKIDLVKRPPAPVAKDPSPKKGGKGNKKKAGTAEVAEE